MIRSLAILDFDGTLADSMPVFLEGVNAAAARWRFRSVEAGELARLRRLGPRAIARELRIPAWKTPLVARHLRAVMAARAEGIRLFPGIADALNAAADAGARMAIVTSNREATVRRVLGPALAGRIDVWECSVRVFGKARAFRRVLRRAGVPAERAICVGDELRDADAAREAGIAFGAVAWGYADPDALRATGPALWFQQPEELRRLAAPPSQWQATSGR